MFALLLRRFPAQPGKTFLLSCTETFTVSADVRGRPPPGVQHIPIWSKPETDGWKWHKDGLPGTRMVKRLSSAALILFSGPNCRLWAVIKLSFHVPLSRSLCPRRGPHLCCSARGRSAPFACWDVCEWLHERRRLSLLTFLIERFQPPYLP